MADLKDAFLFYSRKASDLYGEYSAEVPSGAGGYKTVTFTMQCGDSKGTEYGWPDKTLVWSGKGEDIKNAHQISNGNVRRKEINNRERGL